MVAGTLPLPDGVQPELDSSICSRIGACYANLIEWFIWQVNPRMLPSTSMKQTPTFYEDLTAPHLQP